MDSIQKRAPARSVQLEALYLEALLYHQIFELDKIDFDNFLPEPNGATEGCSPSKVILTHFSTLTHGHTVVKMPKRISRF